MSGTKSLMKNVQKEKNRQSVQILLEWFSTKQTYFKKYVPLQEIIFKKIEKASELTFLKFKEIHQIVADERQIQSYILQKCEKNTLADERKFKPKKQQKIAEQKNQQKSKMDVYLPLWNKGINSVLSIMSNGQKQRLANIQQFYKIIDQFQQQLNKEEANYKSQIKKNVKDIQKLFEKMDEKEKETSKILAKLIKEIKNQQIKDSVYFIEEMKRIQCDIRIQIQCFSERGNAILKLMRSLIKCEKSLIKKFSEQLNSYLMFKKRSIIKQDKSEEVIWKMLSQLEESCQEEILLYFDQVLIKKDKIEALKEMVPGSNLLEKNIQVIGKYLDLDKKVHFEKVQMSKQFGHIFKTLCYRQWQKVHLAQGWLIQSFVQVVIYMTYDSHMLIYGIDGALLKKIQTGSSRVNRIHDDIIYLEEVIKGFFSDSKEEYKLKFDDFQKSEEFQLFIENQIK